MALYGILKKGVENTGLDSELSSVFSAPLSIENKQLNFTTDTITLRRGGFRTDAQRWEIECGISRCDDPADFMIQSVESHTVAHFYIRMPQFPSTFHITYSPEIWATTIAGSTQMSLIGGSYATKIIKGMFVQVEQIGKVYLVKSITGDIATIFPKAKTDITGVLYYAERVSAQVKFDSNTKMGVTFTDGILADITNVRFVEFV